MGRHPRINQLIQPKQQRYVNRRAFGRQGLAEKHRRELFQPRKLADGPVREFSSESDLPRFVESFGFALERQLQ